MPLPIVMALLADIGFNAATVAAMVLSAYVAVYAYKFLKRGL